MDSRPEAEVNFFKYTIYTLQVIRLIALAYYIFQTRNYIRQMQKASIDILSTLTFLFLGLMLGAQIAARTLFTSDGYQIYKGIRITQIFCSTAGLAF